MQVCVKISGVAVIEGHRREELQIQSKAYIDLVVAAHDREDTGLDSADERLEVDLPLSPGTVIVTI